MTREVYEVYVREKAATTGSFFISQFGKKILMTKNETKRRVIQRNLEKLMKEENPQRFLRKWKFLLDKTTRRRVMTPRSLQKVEVQRNTNQTASSPYLFSTRLLFWP